MWRGLRDSGFRGGFARPFLGWAMRLDWASGWGDAPSLVPGEEEASEEPNEWAAIGLLGADGDTNRLVFGVLSRDEAANWGGFDDLGVCASDCGDWKGRPEGGVFEVVTCEGEDVEVLGGRLGERRTAGGDRGPCKSASLTLSARGGRSSLPLLLLLLISLLLLLCVVTCWWL